MTYPNCFLGFFTKSLCFVRWSCWRNQPHAISMTFTLCSSLDIFMTTVVDKQRSPCLPRAMFSDLFPGSGGHCSFKQVGVKSKRELSMGHQSFGKEWVISFIATVYETRHCKAGNMRTLNADIGNGNHSTMRLDSTFRRPKWAQVTEFKFFVPI